MRPDWELELRRLEQASAGVRETTERRNEAILEDLVAAREMLNERLNIGTVRHMCFPWAVAGSAAERLAAEAGYETAFADRLFGARAVRAGDPPYRLMRLKHPYIFCLPGKGRKTFFNAMRLLAQTPPGLRPPLRRRGATEEAPPLEGCPLGRGGYYEAL